MAKRASILLALVAITGCDSSSPSPTPTPTTSSSSTPTPTPTSSLTPSPSPTPTAFPVTGEYTFALKYWTEIANTEVGSAGVLPMIPGIIVADGDRQFIMRPAAWSVANFGPGPTPFTPTHANPVTGNEIIAPRSGTGGGRLTLANNVWPAEQPADAQYHFTYVNYLRWYYPVGQVNPGRKVYSHLFGFPTATAGAPGSGTRAYGSVSSAYIFQTTVTGGLPSSYTIAESDARGTATVNANFAARTVTFQLILAYYGNGIGTGTVATIDATGTIASDGVSIDGTLSSTNNVFTGRFKGTLYGPAGEEIGLVYVLDGSIQGINPQVQDRIAGAIVGK